MAFASFNSTVSINQTGASTAFADEATSSVGAGVYQITNAGKRCWDTTQPVTVKVNGVTASAMFIDYLLGRVVIAGTPAGPVTVSGAYLPLLSVGTARSFSLDVQADLVDITVFKDDRSKVKWPTLFDATFNIDAIDSGQVIFGDGSEEAGNPDTFAGATTGGVFRVLDFVHTTAGLTRRIACFLNSDNVKASPSSVVESSVSGTLTGLALGADISFSEFVNVRY